MRFHHCFCVEANGTSGGLALLWNDYFQVQILESCKNYTHTIIHQQRTQKLFEAFFVYGNPTYDQRRHLWGKVLKLPTSLSMPWLCMGDFNDMYSLDEKDGVRPVEDRRLQLFRQFLVDSALMDMELKGCKYTWVSNPRDGRVTKEKLDRVLVNAEWRSLFPHASAVALPMINSDHSPVVLTPASSDTSGKRFKFEVFWQYHLAFDTVSSQSWNSIPDNYSSWADLLAKVKKSSLDMVKWHKKTFSNAQKEIELLGLELQRVLNNAHHSEQWSHVAQIRKRIDELWKQEELYWGQRSRVKWLKYGDRNSKFFHASTIQRRDRNRLTRIMDDNNNSQEGQGNIMAAVVDHFTAVYNSEEPTGVS